MEGFGPFKLLFIFLIVMLLFGAKRLPEIGGSLGKGIREFKKSIHDGGADETAARAFATPQQTTELVAPQRPELPVDFTNQTRNV